MPKDFKTIDEQIKILKDRGLTVPDDSIAIYKEFLKKNNYYRISGYSLTLRDHDAFYPNTSFQNIIDIYSYDKELRKVLLSAIESIEVGIKSQYAYAFSKEFGGLGYMDASHFNNFTNYAYIMNKANSSIKQRIDNEAYLQHYIRELKEPIPLWAYVDLLSMSDISKLYAISDIRVQKAIAKEYGLTHNEAKMVMSNYLHEITVIRNLCAHNSRLFNRLFVTKPDLNKRELRLLNKDNNGNPDNSKLFGYIIVLKRLLSSEEFTNLKNEIISLCNKYPFVDMKHYGFSPNWKERI